ncbi:MAG: hypothetical protein GY796_00490, partial [Chloroflexi bacterium]|nr:hypothetical protein [Chloroflexota bacterium]
MSKKRFTILALLAAVGILLAACQTAEPQVVEVTRVVTETVVETVEVAGEAVEVTRVVETTVVETVTVEVEVPAEDTGEEAAAATGECCDNYTIGIFEDP